MSQSNQLVQGNYPVNGKEIIRPTVRCAGKGYATFGNRDLPRRIDWIGGLAL
jgi:hypothetical protein